MTEDVMRCARPLGWDGGTVFVVRVLPRHPIPDETEALIGFFAHLQGKKLAMIDAPEVVSRAQTECTEMQTTDVQCGRSRARDWGRTLPQ